MWNVRSVAARQAQLVTSERPQILSALGIFSEFSYRMKWGLLSSHAACGIAGVTGWSQRVMRLQYAEVNFDHNA
jgi:hypothetical protein